LDEAKAALDHWIADDLKNVRFSGGEPLMWKPLPELVEYAAGHIDRVAISTNGSFPLDHYCRLVDKGVNDFSISFDACCAGDCGKMGGNTPACKYQQIVTNIRELSKITYVTVGVVLTDDNADSLAGIVGQAHSLGVADIRIIPAAQYSKMIEGVERIPQEIVDAHPILKFRVEGLKAGRLVRSLQEYDSPRCFLPIDDSVIAGKYHFPCVIYMREQGDPIGKVGPGMRAERIRWSETHDPHTDPICSANCLDFCTVYNNKCASCKGLPHAPN
jgi:hypothetical protein